MGNRTLLFLTGVSLVAAYFMWLRSSKRTPRRVRPLRAEDLYYSHLNPDELISRHLLDLNDANEAQLQTLGLDPDAVQRLLDNRPYRSKLELVSRMVLTENIYATIKDKIGVARGDEPVKTA